MIATGVTGTGTGDYCYGTSYGIPSRLIFISERVGGSKTTWRWIKDAYIEFQFVFYIRSQKFLRWMDFELKTISYRNVMNRILKIPHARGNHKPMWKKGFD
jgi:hypothetical protein